MKPYDENDNVLDPKLRNYLINKLYKTNKL